VDWLKSGGDIHDLRDIFGHSGVKTTEMHLAYFDRGGATVREVQTGTGAASWNTEIDYK
jgi:hypothetical protein